MAAKVEFIVTFMKFLRLSIATIHGSLTRELDGFFH